MNKRSRRRLSVSLSLMVLLSLVPFFVGNALAGKKVKFIYADQATDYSMVHEMGVLFMDKVEKYSDGNIQFKKRMGGVLGDYLVLAEQTSMGAIDISMVWSPADLDPRLDIGWLGWLSKDIEEAKMLYDSEGEMFKILEELYAEVGMKLLMVGGDGISGLMVRKGTGLMDKINTFPGDGNGIKARIPPSKLYETRAKNLGFSPTAIPYSEVYTGLQLGTFDVRFATEPSELMQFGDVLDGWIGINELCQTNFLIMNMDKWNSLSKENQDILTRAAKETAEANWNYLPEYTKKWEQKAVEKFNIKIKQLPAEELENLQRIAKEKEWPEAEKIFGKDLMNRIYDARKSAGLE